MGIDCETLGTLMVFRKGGETAEIGHEETVRICLRAQSEGRSLDDIIKQEVYQDIKLLRIKFQE